MATSCPIIVISDEISQELSVLGAFQREFSLPGLELRSLNGKAFKDLDRDDILELAAQSQSEGWRVFACATPVFKCDLEDHAAVAEHREIFRRSLDVAATLRCDLLRVFTFLRTEPTRLESKLGRITEHLAGLLELAKGSGVRLGIENEHSCLAATMDEVAAVLAPLPHDRAGIIWDPCNVLYVPGAVMPAPRDLLNIMPRVLHIHVKDAVRRNRGEGTLKAIPTPVGIGAVDWRAYLQVLKAANYRGLLSLETHWRAKQLDESMLHLPAGHLFSAGGEAATRTCLHNLHSILETL